MDHLYKAFRRALTPSPKGLLEFAARLYAEVVRSGGHGVAFLPVEGEEVRILVYEAPGPPSVGATLTPTRLVLTKGGERWEYPLSP